MTPTQTTPPASPVPTAGPTKEATELVAEIREIHSRSDTAHSPWFELSDEQAAFTLDRVLTEQREATHLPQLLAVVEAAERVCEKPASLAKIHALSLTVIRYRQSLTAYARAAGKEQP